MGLDLTFEFSESGGKAGPSTSQPPAVTRVRLRREWIRYQDAEGRDVLLDFARRRHIELDEAARTYVDESLHPTVGFRHMELPNRDLGHSIITAGGGDASEFAPVMSEHHLSVLDPKRKRTIDGVKPTGLGARLRSVFSKPARGDITVESTQGHTVFSTAEGRRLFSYSDGGTGVEPDVARRFVQFLRYRFRGHPLILERLASEGRIPREIRYDACHPQGVPYSTVTLRLTAMDTVPEAALSLDGYRRVMAPGEPTEIDSALERVTLGEVPDPEEVMARRMAEARESAEAGRRLEMVLTLFEFSLETGETVPGFGEAIQRDPDVQVRRLVAALTRPPNNEEEARAVAATYVELREPAGRKAHVLGTFEAALRRSLQELDAARELLLKAIAANPFLAGAYKDLGDLYLGAYEARRAWLCWEATRRLAPKLSLVKDISAWEERLAAEHPEYY